VTDLEMTKLCAEAMGFHPLAEMLISGKYDPLHDDAQAMALVKKYLIEIHYWNGWRCGLVNDCTETTHTLGHNTHNTDLNRAIVECVARMQAAKVAE
jgi:hypothetical protein